jgi:hypothetical protein
MHTTVNLKGDLTPFCKVTNDINFTPRITSLFRVTANNLRWRHTYVVHTLVHRRCSTPTFSTS